MAGTCIVAAAVFLLREDFNAAFVAAAIGLVAWFLNYRTGVRQSLVAEELRQDNDQKGGNDSDET